ncbi:MAG: BamA/TamA family outer membrane protein [Prevotella sp.]
MAIQYLKTAVTCTNIRRYLPLRRIFPLSAILVTMIVVTSCSTTKNIPDNDQLYIGLNKIEYTGNNSGEHYETTRDEVEASLATAPNGALFGSSYYRTPFPYALWIWNAFSQSKGGAAKWITKTFGKAPVLMNQVNPQLRASVAQTVMRNHGYLHGSVTYETVTMKNPKKAKIAYKADFGSLYVIDSLDYTGFPDMVDSLIYGSRQKALLKGGDPFDASTMDLERSRIASLLRNNGYYYYRKGLASYLADTAAVPGKVKLRLQLADELPDKVMRKWYIGNICIDIHKRAMEELKDSFSHRYFKVRFNGRRPPIRPRVIMRDLKLRPRQLYSYDNYMESANKINGSGLFNSVEFTFTPRDTTSTCDTLDVNLACTFGKPYDVYIGTNFKNRTNGRMGPELVLGFTKRNAFRGGELLDINLHGAYEWQGSGAAGGSSTDLNSYEYGVDASLELPRLVIPFIKRRRYFTTPSTTAKVAMDVMKRPQYYKMHTVTAEWTYRWQLSDLWRHEFSPLTLKYQKLNTGTEKFYEILENNPYLMTSMQDVFIPKMHYSLTYSSTKRHLNPITWQTTITEAGNMVALSDIVAGRQWGKKNKMLFKNPYAQFIKLETDLTKTWSLGQKSQLVGHINAGVIYTYGNSESAPYSEQFYVGGANSIRAFTVRSIGPGRYTTDISKLSYLDQTGDIRLQMNLEYRFNIFGNLFGAMFLDAGNVWALRDDGYRKDATFKVKNIAKEMALGTGVGIRYDLEFLILRLDWGVGLHVPYETGKSGFYNMPNFKDSHSLHLAVGYPF